MKFIHFRKSDGLLYLIIEPFMHLAYWCLFRKVYLHNIAGVPADKPVLIAANHPTAFIDPMALCIYLDGPVYNMTRGDIFEKPWARRLLEQVNMFPVFRRRDGYTGRERNDGVFEFCQGKMLKNQTVAIYVEGEHHLDKQVRPVQKGLARIAFETFQNHRLEDLQVVPMGTNYIFGDRTRDELKVLAGAPIFIRDYWPVYQENPALAINQLGTEVEKALKALCYHVEKSEDFDCAEQLLTIVRNDHPANLLPVVEAGRAIFDREKKALHLLNTLPDDRKAALKIQANAYFDALRQFGLTDSGLQHPKYGSPGWLLILIVSALPAALGYVLGWPFRFFARTLTKKVVKKKEFVTSVLTGAAILPGILAWFAFLLAGFLLNMPWLMATVVLAPILAWFSFFYRDCYHRYRAARKASQHPERAALLAQRAALKISFLEKEVSSVGY